MAEPLPRALLPLYVGTIVTRLGTFVVPYLTVYLARARSLPPSAIGRVIAAGGAGLLLGNVLGGWLCDRVGRRAVLIAGLAVNVLGLAILSTALPSSGAYAAALALASLGAGMFPPAASAWIADLTTEAQRPRAYAVNYVCINVGMGLGPLLGGVAAGASFRWLFLGDIATSIACALVLAGGRASRARATRREAPSPIDWTPQMRGAVAFGCGSLLLIAPLMGLEYAVPLLVGVELGEPLVLVGVVYTINAACILALGLPLERRLEGRDPHAMMVLAGLLWAGGLAWLAAGPSAVVLLASTVVWTLGEVIASVVVPTTIASRVDPRMRGRALAVPDAMRSVAAIVAPLALGMLWDRSGVQAVLWTLVSLPLVGAAAYGVARWRR